MAIDDNTTYGLTGAQVKDLASKVNAKADASAIPTVNDATLTITQNGTSAGTFTANASSNATIALTDTTYSAFGGATSSAAGSAGLVPAPTTSDPDKYLKGDGTWSNATASLVEMSYGESNAWAKFIAAYTAGSIVYCRASSNSNPATGSQTRKAFMAYVNNATTPTSVEFQYVRSISSHSATQQGDQVFVYTLTSTSGGTWSVVTREMSTKVTTDSSLTNTYSSGTLTIKANTMTGATSSANGSKGYVPQPSSGDQDKVLKGDGTWSNTTNGMIDWSSLPQSSASDKSYIKIGDILIQYGQVSGLQPTSDLTISFPQTFADTNYTLTVTSYFQESGESFWWAFVKSKATTSFVARGGYKGVNASGGGGNSNNICNWIAIGKAA